MGSMILICGVLILLAFAVWGLILATLLEIERAGRVTFEPDPVAGAAKPARNAPPTILSSPHH